MRRRVWERHPICQSYDSVVKANLSLVEIASIATLSNAIQMFIATCPLATQTSLVANGQVTTDN